MAVAISDSSVLIHLSQIDRLDLLKFFFSGLLIPPAVWMEVVEDGKGRTGALEVESAREHEWLQVTTPKNESLVRLLKRNLDTGESEAIALAIENDTFTLLIDEADARRIARMYNIKMTGTLGLLIRAYNEGKIESLEIELKRLVDTGGFYISHDLYEKAQKTVNPKTC